MSLSPRKFVSKFSASKGVEATEHHIENCGLAAYTPCVDSSNARPCAGGPAALCADSASYVQVLVQKASRAPAACRPAPPRPPKSEDNSKWKKSYTLETQHLELAEEMERVEVYRFEHGAAFLVGRGAARTTRVERAARRAARPAAALLAEVLAVARLLIAVPLHVALEVERCVLESVSATLAGAVQTTSDRLLKPALALLFNAVLQPPLACVAQTGAALRSAARPFAWALGDALSAAARPLAALRLVRVERRCACAQRV